MTPALQVELAQVEQMMAVSLMDGNADPEGEVLIKEDASWNIWGEDND